MLKMTISIMSLLLGLNTFAQTINTNQQNSDFLSQLKMDSQCDPNLQQVCYYKVYSTVKLYQVLQHCSELTKWVITYTPTSQNNFQVSITAGDGLNCNVSVSNLSTNPPQTKTCVITPENIKSMQAYPQAEEYLEQYDQTQQLPDQVMYSIFGAFYGCIKGNVNPEFLNAERR